MSLPTPIDPLNEDEIDIDEIAEDEQQGDLPSNNQPSTNTSKFDKAPKLILVQKNTKITITNGILCFQRAMQDYDMEVSTLQRIDREGRSF
jgi:hypothetical protein